MTIENYNLKAELKKWMAKAERIVIAGIGNPIRRDDFVGVRIVQGLKGIVSKKVHLIECETVPENFLEQIVDLNPTHILLIDAAILGLRPGDSKLVKPDLLTGFPALSTHMLPLRIFCEYLEGATKASIALLLVEPKETDFGEGLSSCVQASAKEITGILLSLDRKILEEK